jgi:hypothetical protein
MVLKPVVPDNQDETAEYSLLKLGSRKRLNEVQASEVRTLLGEEQVNWDYLIALAAYHGVQPLLYCHLKGVGAELASQEHLKQLRGIVGARSARSIVLERELGRLASVFRGDDLPLIAVKGPVLAHSVYGSVALRPFVDLDLVVRRSDYPRVEAQLEEDGYRSTPLTPLQKSSYLYIHGQYTFWRRVASTGAASVLDVHTAIMPPGYAYDEDFDDLFERSITVPIAGHDVHALAREDLLLVLCFHGFKNRWDRIKYFCDVAEFLRVYPDLDWEEVHRRAKAMRSERVLWLGLWLAHHLLDAPLPPHIVREVEHDKRIKAVGTAILDRLPQQARMRTEPYLDRVQLNLLTQDGIVGGIRYTAYAAVRRLSELYLPRGN